jgi:hypothetical protein
MSEISRNIQASQLPNQTVSVKDFGAVGDGVTDDTAAIQAAFAASIRVFFPAGTYKTTSPIQIGNGNARYIYGEHRKTTTIENAVSDVFNVGNTNDASASIIEGLSIKSQVGGGHCFEVKYTVSMFTLRDCTVTQQNPNKCLWHQTTGYAGGNIVERCHLIAASTGTMTINPWFHQSNEITNGFTFRDCRCDYSRDGFQFFKIDTTAATSFITQGKFENMTFELTYGGMIWLGGSRSVDIVNCQSYDLSAEQDGHGIFIGKSAGGLSSSRCKLRGVVKNTVGGYTQSATSQDIYLESAGAHNVIIESCYASLSAIKFKVDYQNNRVLHIDRTSDAESTYSNDGRVAYIDFGGDKIGITAHAHRTLTGLSSRELTISGGSISPTLLYHTVDTEASAATDDLDTITTSSLQEGDILTVRAVNAARTVVLKDGTGNLKLAGDFSLDNTEDTIQLLFNGTDLQEVTRSNNGT